MGLIAFLENIANSFLEFLLGILQGFFGIFSGLQGFEEVHPGLFQQVRDIHAHAFFEIGQADAKTIQSAHHRFRGTLKNRAKDPFGHLCGGNAIGSGSKIGDPDFGKRNGQGLSFQEWSADIYFSFPVSPCSLYTIHSSIHDVRNFLPFLVLENVHV